MRPDSRLLQKRPFGGVFLFRPTFWAAAAWVLLAASWLNASHYRPWVNFQSELMALVALAVLALVAGWTTPQGAKQPWPLVATIVLGCTVIPLSHWLTGLMPFGGDLFVSVTYLAALAGGIVVGFDLQLRQTADRAPSITIPWGAVLWVPAVLSALIGVLQWLDYSEVLGTWANHGSPGERPMGNVAQTNQLASLLLMGACGLWFDFERRRIHRTLFVVVLTLLSGVLALTQSRTGLLSATIVAAFIWIKTGSSREATWRLPRCLPLVWGASIWAMFLAVPALNEATYLGGNRNISLMDPNSRQMLWLQMLHAIGESPLWGYGWNQTAAAHNTGALAYPGSLTYSYAHNLVLDLLAWCGIPVGLALVLAIAYWLFTRLRRVAEPVGVAAMAGLLPLIVHSQLEYPFAYAYFLVCGGVLVGIVEACVAPRGRAWAMSSRLLAGTALVLTCLGAYASYEYILAEEDFRVVRFNGMRFGRIPENYVAPNFHLLTQLGAMLAAGRMEVRRGMPAQEVELLRKVALRFPYGALGNKYAQALALNGDPDGARRQMKIMRGMYGARYHSALVQEWHELQATKYPEFARVRLGD